MPQEHDGPEERDSVTKLHQDMSDAVNILNHVQQLPYAPPARAAAVEAAAAGPSGSSSGGGGGHSGVWPRVQRGDQLPEEPQ